MSNKQYFREVKPGDVSVEGRQANGLTADDNGNVFMYSGLKDTELQDLNQKNHQGNIPFYYGNSYLALIKSQTHDNLKLGNEKWDLAYDTNVDKITQVDQSNDTVDCSKEFDADAEELLNWENAYSNGGNSYLPFGGTNKYGNMNLGWGPYGGSADGFEGSKLTYLDNYWNRNTDPKHNSTLIHYIKELPPGLRSMAIQFSYNAGAWHTRLLVAAYNLSKGTLGVPYKQTIILVNDTFDFVRDMNGDVTSEKVYNSHSNILIQSGIDPNDPNITKVLGKDDKILLFERQYKDIIALYNSNKLEFLTSLKDEIKRYYKSLVKEGSDKRFKEQPAEFNKFYDTYVDKAYDLAIKYKDCVGSTQTVATTTTSQQPTQSQTQTEAAPAPTTLSYPPITIPVKAILIGDSQTRAIKANVKSKRLEPLTKLSDGGKPKTYRYGYDFHFPGWSIVHLLKTFTAYKSRTAQNKTLKEYNNTITHIFINIGTNSAFEYDISQIDDIIKLLANIFPNALTMFAVPGSFGWMEGKLTDIYNEGGVNSPQFKKYYNTFEKNGVKPLKNAIGYESSHPWGNGGPNDSKGIKLVGQEINTILEAATDVVIDKNTKNPFNKQNIYPEDAQPVQTPVNQTTGTTVIVETQTEEPAAKVEVIEADEFGGLDFIPREERFIQNPIKDIVPEDFTRNTEGSPKPNENEVPTESSSTQTSPENTTPAPATPVPDEKVTKAITLNSTEIAAIKTDISFHMYMQHQQGALGWPTILTYSSLKPTSKIPRSFTVKYPKGTYRAPINTYMYGKYLYLDKNANIGPDFFPFMRDKYGYDLTIQYGYNSRTKKFEPTRKMNDNEWKNDLLYTPANFVRFWFYQRWKSMSEKYIYATKQYDSMWLDIIKNNGYILTLDEVRKCCYVESGIVPTLTTGSYRGLFQISYEEFNQRYAGQDIFDPKLNSDVGLNLLNGYKKSALPVIANSLP